MSVQSIATAIKYIDTVDSAVKEISGFSVLDTAISIIQEKIKHHPHPKGVEIYSVPFVIEEQATDTIAHKQQVTVIVSPGGRLDNYKIGPYQGKSAKEAKEKCMVVLSGKVQEVYKDVIKK